MGANDPELARRLEQSAAGLGSGTDGIDAAYRALDAQVMNEAVVMSFSDIFQMFALLSVLSVPLVLLLRPIDPERTQGMMH